MSKKDHSEKQETEKIKLDEILKSLFNVSNSVLIGMLNSLFNEDYDLESTKVSFENNEFETDDFHILRGDLFMKLMEQDHVNANHYHIELQTLNDDRMIIRMLGYGFSKARELAKYEGGREQEIVLYMPQQFIIFIEQNQRIEDELGMRLIFPDGQEVKYTVPIMKYWEYSKEDLLEQKLYPLLPLQVFQLRYQMERVKRRKSDTKQELQVILQEARRRAENISYEAVRLYKISEIDSEDLHKILLANAEIFSYLNGRYIKDVNLDEEVLMMTKTLYDPVVAEKAKLEGKLEGKLERNMEIARKLIRKHISIDEIREITELSEEEIERVRKQM